MVVKLHFFVVFAFVFQTIFYACAPPRSVKEEKIPGLDEVPAAVEKPEPDPGLIQTGAEQLDVYLPFLLDKRIGLVANQTSRVGTTHLLDTLLSHDVAVQKVFTPEHGFRGEADAGAWIEDGKDVKSELPIISLYGKNKKPKAKDLKGLDVLVFDIQDVGARFYTYISTLHYVMEACAENDVELLILDRPNPNGHFIDGPILDSNFQSFIGMHPVPVIHGMTMAEYGRMINGEGWLADGRQCVLRFVSCNHYHHQSVYDLPVPPSPNLPNMRAVYLYPSLCFFEGTLVSVGRGTEHPFQLYGAPGYPHGQLSFVPSPRTGASYPKHEGLVCNGFDLSQKTPLGIRDSARLNLHYLLDFYRSYPEQDGFFLPNGFFDLLAGTDQLRKQIQAGWPEWQIRDSWQEDLTRFQEVRRRYLIYREYGEMEDLQEEN
jgi:uncharacterized protein YbbC (DUF1343 family)